MRLVLLLLLVLSLPAYSAVTSIDANTPGAVIWHISITAANRAKLIGSFTEQAGAITDWFFTTPNPHQRTPFQLFPDAPDCFEDLKCNVASFVSPTHLLFQHQSTPASTVTLDFVLDGPLAEGTAATATLRSDYNELLFQGAGAFFAPEPTPQAILGMFLSSLLITRLLGRLRGPTKRSRRLKALA